VGRIMDINEAKELIDEYLSVNIDDDICVLGNDHPYNDTTIGRIQEAYYLLSKEGIFDVIY
jgi:hypothetical protein